MRRALGSTLAIARTSFLETLRAPVFGVTLFAGLALTGLAPWFAIFALGARAQAFVVDLGASSVSLALLFLAAVAAGSGTAERIASGTATLVLAGPTGRGAWVLGTWLGVASALALAGFLLGVALVLAAGTAAGRAGAWPLLELLSVGVAGAFAAHASREGRAPFPPALAALALLGALLLVARLARPSAEPDAALERAALAQAALLALGSFAYAALGVALGTRLPPAAAGALTLAAGLAGAAVPAVAEDAGGPGAFLAAAAFADLQLFSVTDAIYAGNPVPLGYVASAAAQALLHAAGALAIGTLLLDRRELG